MFKFIAWAAHCLSTQPGHIDPYVADLLNRGLKDHSRKPNNVVQLNADLIEPETQKAA
ncbi:MAG: hypothetical protein HOF32_01750 [Gammaproteobacteria bacterium]|nr:hypothetical protein [Gammaproteobacteria bacterium]MDA7833414.1 hypothetical protein [Pseudomonadales bacterium]MBT3710400.1 hypothetical protein [Gammaproteobacteria bacterium]MBT3735650.1 hypothetical protein [Gammaproteobacteria bacterium]MBT3897375.1 hypothetical protein [Gammaproteobacteria bacterium]